MEYIAYTQTGEMVYTARVNAPSHTDAVEAVMSTFETDDYDRIEIMPNQTTLLRMERNNS